MQLARPRKQNRVHVTVTDALTRKSKCVTFYGATRDQVLGKVRQLAKDHTPAETAPATAAV